MRRRRPERLEVEEDQGEGKAPPEKHVGMRKRLPVVAFFLGLYRVYVYDYARSVLDLFRDAEQWAAMKDFFGLFTDHFAINGRSVSQDVFGILMMAAYGSSEQVHGSRTLQRIPNAADEEWIVDCASRAMKFSAAAYGWSMLNHMASIFNLNFMPTAQPDWKGIPTPRSARTPVTPEDAPASASSDLLSSRESSRDGSLSRASTGGASLSLTLREASEEGGDPEMDQGEREDRIDARLQADLRGQATIMSIVEGVNPEDILYSNFTSSDLTFGKLPNHFLVIDHESNSLVVAFRGTFSLSEAITDVNCHPEPFWIGGEQGFAHIAMAKGARMAMSVLEDVILAANAVYPSHRIWIVGHSLGAGVASLFAILLKEKHPDLPIECWCFGCPGVLSLNLARKVPTYFDELTRKSKLKSDEFSPPLSFMQAFSAGDDNVPRLSHGSILDLTAMADTLWEFFNSKKDGFFSAVVYSWRSRQSFLQWVVNCIVILAVSLFIGGFGYAAKLQLFLKRVFRAKGFLPECPEHLKKNITLLRGGDEPVSSMRDISMDETGSLRRLPSLFTKISDAPRSPSSRVHDSVTFDSDSEEASPLGLGKALSRRDRLMTSFSSVVVEATSRDRRDKAVRKAARKFLMAAHHDKLYPPSVVYQIEFGTNAKRSYSSNPLKYYDLEISKPEYFGWLLFSVGMLIHHMPRSYLHSLSTLQEAIKVRRANASVRWAKVRRRSRLSTILSRLNIPPVSIEMVGRLEDASMAIGRWFSSMETAGQRDEVHVLRQKDLKTVKKCVKERLNAKRAWKRARMKTKAIQHWTHADENLQNALRDIAQKQRSLEKLADAGQDALNDAYSSKEQQE
ncbi:alpha/beta hydrolase [Chloropicon primus]|uniref:sn-1-specific diacylglycerol lipase n=1 Tax=Chloropicon primus TaxID=1764295 RepID=A0A5B8MUZ7_9CHLO|nr:alpha/beta hydrolase [Chloropicon primus]|eukprot:QDZ23230.1 alpha/beta hydrolase [Chloropicon primus]